MRMKVREIAEKVGIKNAAQLRGRTGLGMKTSYQLWNEETELVSLNTLNTLCNVLQVGPAMLFEYTPDVDVRHNQGSSSETESKSARTSVRKPKPGTRTSAIGY